MTILVTGGAGYIGSHLVRRLLKDQHKIVVVDNLSTGFFEALPLDVIFEKGDVRDEAFISNVFKKHDIQAVFHLAAKLNIKESILKPAEYYDNNMNGILSLVKVCKSYQVKYMIFSSSATVYGDANSDVLLVEDSKLVPLNPYGWTKLLAEQILRDCELSFGLKSVSLRYFNAAGASLDGQNGQRTANAYHLIHKASQAAVGPKKLMDVWGTDYQTFDGTCIRDYIHVEDLADLHVMSFDYLIRTKTSEIFNCGYGHGYSVQQVIQCMEKISNQRIDVIKQPRRPGDAVSSVADVQKIKKYLGWIPKYDDIELICKSAYDWEKKLKNI